MKIVIVDCYTDEPAGLGVPPYLGVYPRYLFGEALANKDEPFYLRIDDLREARKPGQKTDILTFNRTKNTKEVIKEADLIIVIAGIQTPGKYLSAIPGTVKEAARLLAPYNAKKLLAGPSAGLGGQQFGGKKVKSELDYLDGTYLIPNDYKEINKFAPLGVSIVDQIKLPIIAEIELGKGCARKTGCSFCTEPLKNKHEWRKSKEVIKEVIALKAKGVEHFRLGKQSDFFSYPEIEILEKLHNLKLKTLHIDNVDPAIAAKRPEISEAIAKYCTSGNVAALGVESFDEAVIKANNINSSPKQVLDAIMTINKFGAVRGENGLPKFLPGINLILGLLGENKKSLELNLKFLKEILDSGMLFRRINIRQINVFPGTFLAENGGLKYWRKNRKHYFSFRKAVREQIDHEMLKKIVPIGTILKDVFMEVHDGNHTFGRQFGSYPLIVGLNERIELRKFYNIKVTGHMLRSVTGIIQTENLTL